MSSTPTPTPYKPSPLSFNSPRQSPFRRPGSIREASPSTLRPTTPNTSPLKPKDTPTTPSQANLRQSTASNPAQNPPSWLNTRGGTTAPEAPTSPTRNAVSPTRQADTPTQSIMPTMSTASLAARFESGRDNTPSPLSIQKAIPAQRSTPVQMSTPGQVPTPVKTFTPVQKPVERLDSRPAPLARSVTSDAMSKVPPPLLHSMRESFSLMDRDNNGHVNSADVSDMLSQLGLSATPSQLSTYFNGASSINLATYLSTLSDLMAGLSHADELSAAFEAFDDGDDGQIDVAELKDALLHTAPEPGEKRLTEREIDMVMEGFSARRAFGKGAKSLGRSEIFRYQDFMANLTGGGEDGSAAVPA